MMSNKTPLVVTIIVHYQSPDECATLVGDLEQLSYPNHQIVVVDNQSSQDSFRQLESLLQSSSAYIVRNEANDGYGSGINFGVANAQHFNPSYYHIINCDTRVANFGYLASLVSQMELNPQLALVGPAVKMMDGKIQNTIMPFVSLQSVLLFKNRHKSKSHVDISPKLYPADVINGVCFVVSARAFKIIKGFDPDYFMYGEEHDLCFRLYGQGLHCAYWSGESIIHSIGHKDHAKLICWRDILVRCNQILFLKKHNRLFSAFILSLLFSFSFTLKLFRGFVFEDFTFKQVISYFFNPILLNQSFVKKIHPA